MSLDKYEPVIGLEVHCQLSTESKIFCSCKARLVEGQSVSHEQVNANTCPVCAGHPGTLPVLNRRVVEYAIRAGLGTNCTIRKRSVFSRKNYFYPDLPKGYQITQFDLPICEKGHLEVDVPEEGKKKIGITRIHIEEDAGKNLHLSGFSIVNLNRAGVPLIEIVSEPDIRTSAQAGAYLRALHQVVTYLGICDGSMQEGHFRCDANVSVRLKGSEKFGTRAEIKNVNSFRFVEKAIEVEIARQIEVLESGGKVIQETRGYDSKRNRTMSLRSKEEAHDYRYFPEPDLIPLVVDPEWIAGIAADLPELPAQKRARFCQWGLSEYDAQVITGSIALADFFERASEKSHDPITIKCLANLLTGEVARLSNEAGVDVSGSKLTPKHLSDLVPLILGNRISSTGAKTVIMEAWASGQAVDAIIQSKGLAQVSDVAQLQPAVQDVVAKFPEQVGQIRAGKDKVMGFLVGQVMKATGGKADPVVVQELLRKAIASG